MCSEDAQCVEDYLNLKYKEKLLNIVFPHFVIKRPTPSLSENIQIVDEVIREVFNRFNIYDPEKPITLSDIDFTDYEIEALFKKWNNK